ncbi:maleylacetate reductase [Xylophilus sp. Leaf220]|uniref:maleylacetate reductase n=1 Tax=Xylophilus sp. Leaf220 TaxID=1735686 RepID=UPI0006F2D40E|nr:maleylacetate reductase [Xylophilus sp. Leaf220]KQM71114.1 Maleylacetate reductase [Xylophilus sp. Leaf220]
MEAFHHEAPATRTVFGAGSIVHLAREIERLGARRALVLSTPGQAAAAHDVADRLGPRAAGVFARAAMHVPIETVRDARDAARQAGADCAVAFGGGSTIGLGKAIALESSLPILAIPTTYAGSEMTAIYGITDAGHKRTGRDERVRPRTVLYDPELTYALPTAVSVASALNAVAHAAEGLYAQDGHPMSALMAQEGIRAIAGALPAIRLRGDDRAGRAGALYGAWLCGAVLGGVGMALHHKLCHVLGGSFGLPHAEVHAVVLPHAVDYNAVAAPEAMQRIRTALDAPDGTGAGGALYDLARDNGAPLSLQALGLPAGALDRAADIVVAEPYWNPRPVGPAQRQEVRDMLQRAFEGCRPG